MRWRTRSRTTGARALPTPKGRRPVLVLRALPRKPSDQRRVTVNRNRLGARLGRRLKANDRQQSLHGRPRVKARPSAGKSLSICLLRRVVSSQRHSLNRRRVTDSTAKATQFGEAHTPKTVNRRPFFARTRLPTPGESSVSDYNPDPRISPPHNPRNPDAPRDARRKFFAVPCRNFAGRGEFFFAARVAR